jgi:hypothetical protein
MIDQGQYFTLSIAQAKADGFNSQITWTPSGRFCPYTVNSLLLVTWTNLRTCSNWMRHSKSRARWKLATKTAGTIFKTLTGVGHSSSSFMKKSARISSGRSTTYKTNSIFRSSTISNKYATAPLSNFSKIRQKSRLKKNSLDSKTSFMSFKPSVSLDCQSLWALSRLLWSPV